MNRYDIEKYLCYGLLGLAILIIISIVVLFIGALFVLIILALIWVIDFVNGVYNPLDIWELLGIIIILASIFNSSTVIKVIKDD